MEKQHIKHEEILEKLGFEIVTHPNFTKERGFIKNINGVIHRIYIDGNTINFAGFLENEDLGDLSYWNEKYSAYSFWLDKNLVDETDINTLIRLFSGTWKQK